MNRLSRILASLLVFGIACLAPAGQYDVSYSGGACSSTGDGPGAQWDYSLENGEWGGTALTSGYHPSTGLSGPGSASCSGAVTATFTWNNGGDPTSTPPPAVFVKETSTASWAGDSGDCANGLLNSPTGGPNGEVSTGFRWTVKANPGNSFSLAAIDPFANVTRGSTNFGPVPPGVCSVKYKTEVYQIRLGLSGTKPVNGTPTLLVGQRLFATLDLGGLPEDPGDTFTWSVSNAAPFSNYEASADSGVYTTFTPTNSKYMQCWFAQASPRISITCTFNSVATNSLVGIVKRVATILPDYDLSYTMGFWQIHDGAFKLWGAVYNQQTAGVHFFGAVSTPLTWFEGTDKGTWNIAQVLHSITVWKTDGNSYWDGAENFVGPPRKNDGLTWPYSPQWPADGVDRYANDTPTTGAVSGFIRFHDSSDFSTYQLYKPPGIDSKFVPLKSVDWSFAAEISRPSVNDPWGQPTGATPTSTLRNIYRPHPVWTGKVGPFGWKKRN